MTNEQIRSEAEQLLIKITRVSGFKPKVWSVFFQEEYDCFSIHHRIEGYKHAHTALYPPRIA
jgi:hypothetical protein